MCRSWVRTASTRPLSWTQDPPRLAICGRNISWNRSRIRTAPSSGRTNLQPAVCRGSGRPGVYAEVPQVGATQVLDGTIDPAWTGETFVVPLLHPISRWVERAALRGNCRARASPIYVEPILRLEMYDYNTLFKDVVWRRRPDNRRRLGTRAPAGLCRPGLPVTAAARPNPRRRRVSGPCFSARTSV